MKPFFFLWVLALSLFYTSKPPGFSPDFPSAKLFSKCQFRTTQPGVSLIDRRPGKDFALFFATDVYDSPAWRKLNNPVKDAGEIALDLQELYGFQTEVVTNPTRRQVLEKLIEYATRKTYPADAQLLVFFTGHGHYDDLAKDGYIIPRDGKASLDDPFGDSWLKHTDLRRRISGIPCPHILLAVDACFSGTIDEAFVFKNEQAAEMDRPGEADVARNQRITDLLRPRTRIYITSGEKNYTPDPSEFAAQFKAGLRHLGGKDGLLDIQELYHNYLKKARSRPQLGAFETNETGSTFLFDYRGRGANAPAPSTDADRDADGIPDTQDACPGEYGLPMHSGCPDTDEDGLPDKDDACPLEKGPVARKGCPAPADRDADGVPDAGDQCPDAKGLVKYQGCPDTDGDGVPDQKDNCPKVKGLLEKAGCPKAPVRVGNMILVKGGTFEMGDFTGNGDEDTRPVHEVTVSDFYLNKTEVTYTEYGAYCLATNQVPPSYYGSSGGKRPVPMVGWLDAVKYCNWLSDQQKLAKVYTIRGDTVTPDWYANGYRLPTEAEWEYAARSGGRNELFAGTNNVNQLYKYVNFCDKNCEYAHRINEQNDRFVELAPVGLLFPNAFGLYDMSGNLAEWCWDKYHSSYYSKSAKINPTGSTEDNIPSYPQRVIRGGSWYSTPFSLRTTARDAGTEKGGGDRIGFRLARNAGDR